MAMALALTEADGAFVTNGELPAAACTAARKYGAAILSLHAHAKAMGLGAGSVVGLKRSLRHFAISFSVWVFLNQG